ncbi:pre-mRNA-splicing factor SYF1 [Trypanosoma conorhini]|uniref:Pre-mRNA-splicing factor SYF1 n=1 Tax=Trypanosoma conorhini TaxID=83891 RepID=A0A422PBK9_9TRYP|nr:pre-mRNA-splicing factor SYF1 [Trypanosoma conorhini]RNF15091.1 pre-mRNA-splicing factor SYF1 [Trypanosoma conorhini]
MGSLPAESLEQEVLRAPASVKAWLRLVHAIQGAEFESSAAKANATNIAYERALRANGFSYKLWMRYIAYRQEQTKGLSSSHEWFRALRDIYDRAVDKLPMMPLLWVSFLEFLMDAAVPPRLTLVRHTILRALRALPVTQHHRVWRLAKRWAQQPHVPAETAKYLWRLYLLFDPRAANQRDYFLMLWEKGSPGEFLTECAAFLLDGAPHEDLLRDTTFWETARLALETKDLRFGGDLAQIEKLVVVAAEYCASAAEFKISHAVFLAGQGEFAKARVALWALLENADDPTIFSRAFSMAVAFEDQIVDSLAMDPSIQACTTAERQLIVEKLCGDTRDPLSHLLRLTQQHALLLNQVRLRENRRDTAMWLKRVELLQEMMCDNRASHDDVVALYRQAIAQCSSGLQLVELEVAQLFESYACYLWDSDSRRDAIALLKDAAWHISFSSTTGNLLLLGLLVEFMLMSSTREDCLRELLSKLQEVNASNPVRSRGLVKGGVVTGLQEDSRAWMLAVDVAFDDASAETLANVIDAYNNSAAYSAEGACYVAGRLWHSGHAHDAFREFERALVAFKGAPVAMLYVLQQYLSSLCLSRGEQLPLHRLRELTRLGLEAVPRTLHFCPAFSVEYLLNCAALESRLGLFDTAVKVAQDCLEAVQRCGGVAEGFLLCLADTVLDVTLTLQGSQMFRQYCAKLLQRPHLHAPFVQRVALWWAAVEKRTDNVATAHTVMDACCKLQDPNSSHGCIFWSLWESICTTVGQFEEVHKRRQQVALQYADAATPAAEALATPKATKTSA